MIKNTVLIVDDDEAIRDSLKYVLEFLGFRVLLAENGQAALTLISHTLPSLILLDIMMPVMNGWEFLEAMMHDQNLSTIPVIVMSAFQFEQKVHADSVTYLKKPLSIDDLTQAINTRLKVA